MEDCKQDLETIMRLLTQASSPWDKPSFMRDMLGGAFRWDLISPFPRQDPSDQERGDRYLETLEAFLVEKIDPAAIDLESRLPKDFRTLMLHAGLLTLTLDSAHGGEALSFRNLTRVLEMTGSWSQTVALGLSVHNCIAAAAFAGALAEGPVREHVLERLRHGALSGLAATESHGASNIIYCATAELSEDGEFYILNGRKVCIGNGPVADYLVTPVSTRNASGQIEVTVFLVDTRWDGFSRGAAQSYMGMHGLFNGVVCFENVRVPKEYLLGPLGQGLKLVLDVVAKGKLFIPSLCLGAMKQALRWVKDFGETKYMDAPLRSYQLTQELAATLAAEIYAQEALLTWTSLVVDHGKLDPRIELGIAKTSASDAAWRALDSTMQLIAARGYEKADSLAARGLPPYPVERFARDIRVHRIFGTTNELVRLATGQTALQFASQSGGPAPTGFPSQYLSEGNRSYLASIAANAKRLQAAVLAALGQYGAGILQRQTMLSAFGAVAERLCTMALTLARAEADLATCDAQRAAVIQDLASRYCVESSRVIEREFERSGHDDIAIAGRLSNAVASGAADWLLDGVIQSDPRRQGIIGRIAASGSL